MLLFAHVMLHPWVHAIGMGKAVGGETYLSDASATPAAAATGDHCELCRVGHSAAVAAQLPQTDLLNPRWIRTALQSVNCSSLQADRRIPSRAPPAL